MSKFSSGVMGNETLLDSLPRLGKAKAEKESYLINVPGDENPNEKIEEVEYVVVANETEMNF